MGHSLLSLFLCRERGGREGPFGEETNFRLIIPQAHPQPQPLSALSAINVLQSGGKSRHSSPLVPGLPSKGPGPRLLFSIQIFS